MARRSKKKSTQIFDKAVLIISVLVLISAWWLGNIRVSEQTAAMLGSMIEDSEQISLVEPQLYKVSQQGKQTAWLSIGQGVGYGGQMTLATKVDMNGNIIQTNVLSIKDTSSYVSKIIEEGLFEDLLGSNTKTTFIIDGVSGATLSSNGVIQAANNAADPVREQLFGYRLNEEQSALSAFGFIDLLAVLIFGLAVAVSRSSSVHRLKMQWAIMLASLGVFGIYSAALISSSTMAILISGSWVHGLGNYTTLILLLCTISYIVLFNKNLYCQMICPMGTVQQCLSKLTNAKAVSFKQKTLIWFPRFLLLAVLAFNLYFQNPAGFTYEPFGIMFGMVGSMYLFIGTVIILITSLFIHRPWCKTLCPVSAMSDSLIFARSWYKQASKDKKKRDKKKAKANQSRKVKKPSKEQIIPVAVKEK